MKQIAFYNLIAEMVLKNVIDDKVNYFLACNCTEDDERIYIYLDRIEDKKPYFKLETYFRTLKTYELKELINFLVKNYGEKDIYRFYNASILEK